jgi:hypothetical protein
VLFNVRERYPTGSLRITDSAGRTQSTSPGSPIELALLDALREALKTMYYEPPAGSPTEDAEQQAKARYGFKKHGVVAAIQRLEKPGKTGGCRVMWEEASPWARRKGREEEGVDS